MVESQNGFRKGKSTQDSIFVLAQIREKLIRKGKQIYVCFIDWKSVQENKKKWSPEAVEEVVKFQHKNKKKKGKIHNPESNRAKSGIKAG